MMRVCDVPLSILSKRRPPDVAHTFPSHPHEHLEAVLLNTYMLRFARRGSSVGQSDIEMSSTDPKPTLGGGGEISETFYLDEPGHGTIVS